MTRLHGDPVEVRRHDTGLGLDPAQFLWRGRLYVVRAVLARWTEAGQWWRATSVRALHTGEVGTDVVEGLLGIDDGERSWWRVEAARGAQSPTGVYDLCLDEAVAQWSLVRVLD